MTLNKIFENIKKHHSVRIYDLKKMSQELLTPVMTPPQKTEFFYLYIIYIIEIL